MVCLCLLIIADCAFRVDERVPIGGCGASPQASFHVEGGGPLAVEDRELAGSLEYLAYLLPYMRRSANQLRSTLHFPANQPDPPAITHRKRSPLFQRKRAFLLHHPLPPPMQKSYAVALPHKRQRRTKASFHVEGGGPRERWRIENSLSH